MDKKLVYVCSVALALILVSCGDSGTSSADGDLSLSSGEELSSSSAVSLSSSIPFSSSVMNSSSSIPSSSSVVMSSSLTLSSSSVVMYSSLTPSSSSVVLSSSSVTKDWFNAAISYGSLTDTRDNQVYKTVVIGTQTWMAENLNFDTLNGTGSWCYSSVTNRCSIYGRLYDWNTVMAGSASSSATPSGVHGICPTGWHVPSSAEWNVLTDYVGGANTAGTKLKANSNLWSINKGTDDYGFSALPGGGCDGSDYYGVGYYGCWWSATAYAYSSTLADGWYMGYNYTKVYSYYDDESYGFSLRCVMN